MKGTLAKKGENELYIYLFTNLNNDNQVSELPTYFVLSLPLESAQKTSKVAQNTPGN